ncbi:hypothetical protein EBR21_09670, partial [bacterium]|nr:hypothetical protein [bacterium]
MFARKTLLQTLCLALFLATARESFAQETDPPSPTVKTKTEASKTKSDKSDAGGSPGTQAVSSSARGQVKGIVDGKPRFDCKEFTDIIVGQKFIVEGKTPGQIAATIE